jgi:hypothetical protein
MIFKYSIVRFMLPMEGHEDRIPLGVIISDAPGKRAVFAGVPDDAVSDGPRSLAAIVARGYATFTAHYFALIRNRARKDRHILFVISERYFPSVGVFEPEELADECPDLAAAAKAIFDREIMTHAFYTAKTKRPACIVTSL